MTKRGVLIGCNYPGTTAELKGCINDVRRMHRCLLDRYGFAAEHIAVLVDTDEDPNGQPTGRNIRAALSALVASADPGDVLFVHYSGHGTRLPAEDDDTGYDECIVPTDMNLITDDEFRGWVNKVPEGCRITIVADSCHSGGLIDAAKEQIGESTKKKTKIQKPSSEKCFGFNRSTFSCKNARDAVESRSRSRSLPLPTLIEILKQKTGNNSIRVGRVRPSLYEIFGKDASPRVKEFMKAVRRKIDRGERKAGGEILISGCQSDQTAGDTSTVGEPNSAYGVLSNAIQRIIAEAEGREVSNRKLVVTARKLLKCEGFEQRPGLYCNDHLVNAPFIC